jgi:hypothetical protein
VEPTGRLVKVAFHHFRTDGRIEAARLDLGEARKPAAVAELLMKSARRRLSAFVPGTRATARMRGMTGVVVEYRGRLGGEEGVMRYRHAVFCRGAIAYVLTVSAPAKGFHGPDVAFWTVLAGLEIKE